MDIREVEHWTRLDRIAVIRLFMRVSAPVLNFMETLAFFNYLLTNIHSNIYCNGY